VNKKALTLLEIIISVMILSLVVTGLVNVFVAGKRFIQHSRFRMGAVEIGKQFVDPLQDYVRQDTWDTACFGNNSLENATNGTYKAAYLISNLSNNTTLKRVKTTIYWTE